MAKRASGANREEIDPHCEWIKSEETDTLLIDGSGFKKEQLKVQVGNSQKLKISGDDGQRRFLKEFNLPKSCDIKQIQAKFDEGMLYVIVPKPIPQVHSSNQGIESSSNKNDNLEEDKKHDADGLEEDMKHDTSSTQTMVSEGGGVLMGLRRHWKLTAVFVAFVTVVLLGIVIYAGFNLKKP